MTRLDKAFRLANKLQYDPTQVTPFEIERAADTIHFLLSLLRDIQEEKDGETTDTTGVRTRTDISAVDTEGRSVSRRDTHEDRFD